MPPSEHTLEEPAPQTAARDAVRDRRPRPRGVLPRHLQTWIMMGLAAAMLLIILFSGRPQPPRRAAADASPQASAALSPDRLKKYQEQLTQQEARLRQEMAESQAAAAAAQNQPQPGAFPDQKPADPIADEQRRRQYSSLFAENVAFTRRSAGVPVRLSGEQPSPSDRQNATALPLPSAYPQPPLPAVAVPASSANAPAVPAAPSTPAPLQQPEAAPKSVCDANVGTSRSPCLLVGSVIEAVLTNRLDGSFSGPANAMVTTPVFSVDRQTVLIPAGTRVLGIAAPVQAFGESRLAVRFHRLVLPSGETFNLDQFPGLNQRGDAGLKDQVNRHYLQLFGASAAIGALSGLAQFSTRSPSSAEYGFADAYRQGLGGRLAASGGRILERFLNVLPTITIREGHRLKIYLTSDLSLVK